LAGLPNVEVAEMLAAMGEEDRSETLGAMRRAVELRLMKPEGRARVLRGMGEGQVQVALVALNAKQKAQTLGVMTGGERGALLAMMPEGERWATVEAARKLGRAGMMPQSPPN
jgi:hypothetical protein